MIKTSGGFRVGKGHPLAASNVLLRSYITAQVHQMIMQQWHAATTTRHSYTRISSVLISRRLTRYRVASRYSVQTGFTLFTDSEVGHVCCNYVMHYSSVCKRESWRVRNTEKQVEGEIYVKLL